MSRDLLAERGKSLEDEFFHKMQEKQLARLREELERKETRDALRTASGIADEAVLDQLVTLGVSGQTLAALSLVPLVWVAWSDGKLEQRERDAILKAAHDKGIVEGSATHEVFADWLERRPSRALFEAWASYIKALSETLVPAQRDQLKEQITGLARSVAQSAGGFLGLKKSSKDEENALAAVESAFGDTLLP